MIMMSTPLKRDYKWIKRKTRKERAKNTGNIVKNTGKNAERNTRK